MTTVHRANKIRIYPTAEQAKVLAQRLGASRFCWNECLKIWATEYEAGRKPTGYSVAKLFRLSKPEWFKDMDASIIDRVTANMQTAFKNFFAKRDKYPKPKRRGQNDSYQIKVSAIKIAETSLSLPKLKFIKMSRPLFHAGKLIGNATVSQKAGRWYVSVPVEAEVSQHVQTGKSVGVDLGVRTFATLSTGEKIEKPKHLKDAEKRLARWQRKVARRTKGGANRAKAQRKVQRIHASVSNQRAAFVHKVTSRLAVEFDTICVEDLSVKGMIQGGMGKSVADAGFSMFRTQLEYKAVGRVNVVNRWFPSSKTCSSCGYVNKKLSRSASKWVCPECSSEHDRDLNASINILRAFHPTMPTEDGVHRLAGQLSGEVGSLANVKIC